MKIAAVRYKLQYRDFQTIMFNCFHSVIWRQTVQSGRRVYSRETVRNLSAESINTFNFLKIVNVRL